LLDRCRNPPPPAADATGAALYVGQQFDAFLAGDLSLIHI
jgi:hypothetical protein